MNLLLCRLILALESRKLDNIREAVSPILALNVDDFAKYLHRGSMLPAFKVPKELLKYATEYEKLVAPQPVRTDLLKIPL